MRKNGALIKILIKKLLGKIDTWQNRVYIKLT